MKKALIVASVASMIDQFNMNNIAILQGLGYDVHVACNFEKSGSITIEKSKQLQRKLSGMNVLCFQTDFSRSVYDLISHLKSYKQIRLLSQKNQYSIVHCHSPIGGLITRLACKNQRKNGLKVIYTAHGFHFYKGAPLKNWLFYYPIEKYCSRFTDTLITINHEDYALAQKEMKAKCIEYVPGVGIDIEKFAKVEIDRKKKRNEIGVPADAVVLLSVGELNKNKNHQVIIKAMSVIGNPKLHYVLVGQGGLSNTLKELAVSLGLGDNVHLLGFRNDVNEIMKCADIYVHPSFREGLPVSVMEAKASGLPIIGKKIRGLCDLVPSKYLVTANDANEYAKLILETIADLCDYKAESVSKYSYMEINKQMIDLYNFN